MAAISRYKAEQYVTKIFKEYLGALKEAKRNKEKLLPEANILFEGMDEFEDFINSNNLQQKVYNRLNLEGIKELFNEAKLLALYYDLESFTSVKDCEIDTDTPNGRFEEIKELLAARCVLNDKEDRILAVLHSFTDDELRIIQEDLYKLQKELYQKLNFSQNEKVREFFLNPNKRKGLFVTKDEAGNIVKLSYAPGNDIVFVNRKGELLDHGYGKWKGGSRSKFFGEKLGIGQKRADMMLQVAGYDYDSTAGMNIPTKDKKRRTFTDFNIYGNELKIDITPEHKGDKIKEEAFNKFPEIYAVFGSRISGINGTIIELDDGTGKVLGNVPYFHQRDNRTDEGTGKNRVYGDVMCQLTSLAMVLASKGVKPTDPTKQLEDELYEIAKKEGYGYGQKKALWDNPIEMYKKVIPRVSGTFDSGKGSFYQDKKLEKILAQIDSGNSIIVDIKYGDDLGHVVVCIGYTKDALIIHDPYGNLEKGTNSNYGTDKNGAYVEYPKNKYDIGNHWIRYLEEKDI